MSIEYISSNSERIVNETYDAHKKRYNTLILLYFINISMLQIHLLTLDFVHYFYFFDVASRNLRIWARVALASDRTYIRNTCI